MCSTNKFTLHFSFKQHLCVVDYMYLDLMIQHTKYDVCMSISPGSEQVGGASISPDDDVFIHLAKVYSFNHASMHIGGRCPDSRLFSEGITNGYQWYPLSGQHVNRKNNSLLSTVNTDTTSQQYCMSVESVHFYFLTSSTQ